jgi:transcriptional regulator with XRE-family HTH domain
VPPPAREVFSGPSPQESRARSKALCAVIRVAARDGARGLPRGAWRTGLPYLRRSWMLLCELGGNPVAFVDKRLGHKVSMYRRRAGLTQAQLAKQLHVAPETINRLERGKAMPSVATIDRVASALGVELAELLGTGERPTKKTKALDRLLAAVGDRTAAEIELLTSVAKAILRRDR